MRRPPPRLETLEARRAAYNLGVGTAWGHSPITFSVQGGDPFEREQAAQALSVWAEAAPLHFLEVGDLGPFAEPRGPDYPAAGTADIRFFFGAVTSPGVGMGFYPPAPGSNSGLAGDVFIGGAGEFLANVLAHEAGHALGLRHTDVPGSLMLPEVTSRTQLGPDDAAGIRAVYGAGVGSVAVLSLEESSSQPPPAEPFPGFAGDVLRASADLDGDGVADSVFIAQGAQGHAKVFDGATGAVAFSALLYPGFLGEVALAAQGCHFAAVAEGAEGHLMAGTLDRLTASAVAFPGYRGDVALAFSPDGSGSSALRVTAEASPGVFHTKEFCPDGGVLLSSRLVSGGSLPPEA